MISLYHNPEGENVFSYMDTNWQTAAKLSKVPAVASVGCSHQKLPPTDTALVSRKPLALNIT